MGSCESGKTNVKTRRNPFKEDDRERNKIDDHISDQGSEGKGLKERQLHISHYNIDQDRKLANIYKSICTIKLVTPTGDKISDKIFNGFLIQFWIKQEQFFFLMTNEKTLKKNLLNNNIDILILYDREERMARINLRDDKRFKRSFVDEINTDITMIEILEKDNIPIEFFLGPESRNLILDDLVKEENNQIYVPKLIEQIDYEDSKYYKEIDYNILKEYYKEIKFDKLYKYYYQDYKIKRFDILYRNERDDRDVRDVKRTKDWIHIRSEIKSINKYEFVTFQNEKKKNEKEEEKFIDEDIIGNPIFLRFSLNVIGIVKSVEIIKDENNNNKIKRIIHAEFIHPAINLMKIKIPEKINLGKFKSGKYVWNDGKYYIGEFNKNNSLPNGKGIKYNPDGTVLYMGEFVDGKFDGKGEYLYRNSKKFFIGEYKNGLRNGKGIIYYPDGRINVENNYVNDQKEGEGRYICEDGSIYNGFWKNGLFTGRGKEFYSNGDLRYEGEYVDGRREGKGKYIWRDGDHYEGYQKNDLRHGKGKQYDASGALLADGNWVDDFLEDESSTEKSEKDKKEKEKNKNKKYN